MIVKSQRASRTDSDFTTERFKKKNYFFEVCHSPDKDRKFRGIPGNPDRILQKSPDNENRAREHTSY